MLRVSSLFSQLLHHFPRSEFASLVKKHNAEYKAKGFTCWSQFVSMIFCHLAGAGSLRDIRNGLKCCLGKVRHLDRRLPPPAGMLLDKRADSANHVPDTQIVASPVRFNFACIAFDNVVNYIDFNE